MIGFLPQLGLAAVLLIGGNSVIHAHLTLGQFTAFYLYLNMLIGADALARRDARPGPARDRLGRAHLPGARPRAAHRAAARRASRCRPATATCSCAASRCATTKPTSSAPAYVAPRELALDADRDGVRRAAARRASGAQRRRPRRARRDAPSRSSARTGSGKTSLVSLISRLYDTSAGEVLLDGADVRDGRPALAAPGGRGRQRRPVPVLGDASPRTSPTGARRRAREEIEAAARRAQAYDFIARLPAGLSTRASASAGCRCPAASASAWRSPARCSPTRAC